MEELEREVRGREEKERRKEEEVRKLRGKIESMKVEMSGLVSAQELQ